MVHPLKCKKDHIILVNLPISFGASYPNLIQSTIIKCFSKFIRDMDEKALLATFILILQSLELGGS